MWFYMACIQLKVLERYNLDIDYSCIFVQQKRVKSNCVYKDV